MLRVRALGAATLLARLDVRAVLSAAIVVSLLPFPWVRHLDFVFLLLFGAELLARATAALGPAQTDTHGTPARHRAWALTLLLFDLLALFSFLPWSAGRARWLRLLRLSRMLLLIGYWGPVVRDLRQVLTQRERSRQVFLMGFVVALSAFVGAVVLHELAPTDVDFDGDGRTDALDARFTVRLWWAFRQLQDPGNMLQAPTDLAAVVVSVLLTVAGLFLVSFLIGLAADVVASLVELGRNRAPGLRQHLLVVHVTPTTSRLLTELVRHYQKMFTVLPAVLLGRSQDRPAFLDGPGLRHIVYRCSHGAESEALLRADACHARRIVVQADPRAGGDADAETARFVLSLRQSNPDAQVVAEVLDPRNVSVTRVAGGPHTIIVPTEKLMGLLVAATATQPHLEALLREVLSSKGHEIYSYLYDSEDFDRPGPALMLPDGVTHRALVEAGLEGDGPRAVMLGVLRPPARHRPYRPLLGPTVGDRPVGEAVHGVVAVAENFEAMRAFACRLQDRPLGEPTATRPLPVLRRAGLPPPTRVLVCGFRPAAVHMLEAMMLAAPEVRVQLLVRDEAERAGALTMLDDHTLHQHLGLWHEAGPTGRFELDEDGVHRVYRPDRGPDRAGHLRIDVADWTSESVLLGLPEGSGLAEVDLAVVLGDPHPDRDAITAMTVLKMADLIGTGRYPFRPHFRVLALVVEDTLGALLESRFCAAAGLTADRIDVFATREFGAYFSFQSAVVPGFDAIYSELLSPWGQTFTRLVVDAAEAPDTAWTYAELARAFVAGGRTLVGVELAGPGRPTLRVAPSRGEPGDRFSLGQVVSLWVVAEQGDPG